MTIRIKRSTGSNAPATLAFGEMAWSDGNNVLRIGKGNGIQQVIGEKFDFKQATSPDTTGFQGGEIWIETDSNGEEIETWEWVPDRGLWGSQILEFLPSGNISLNVSSSQSNLGRLLLPHPCLITRLGIFYHLIGNNTATNNWTITFRLIQFSGTGASSTQTAIISTANKNAGTYFDELIPVFFSFQSWSTLPQARILDFTLTRNGAPPNISLFNTPYCLYQKTRPL